MSEPFNPNQPTYTASALELTGTQNYERALLRDGIVRTHIRPGKKPMVVSESPAPVEGHIVMTPDQVKQGRKMFDSILEFVTTKGKK